MDNVKAMSVLFAGIEFARRGWNTLAIDGPGQGESLRLRGLYARHDYEVPGTAAYEYVAGRREVNPQKVVIMGYSFGGYYASRIAAFEKRYCAGVAMSALHWDLAAWQREVKRRHEIDPKTTPQSSFHFRWIMGADDIDTAIERAARRAETQDMEGRGDPGRIPDQGESALPVRRVRARQHRLPRRRRRCRLPHQDDLGASRAGGGLHGRCLLQGPP